MARLVTAFGLYTGLLAILALPVMLVALLQNRTQTIRRFVQSGLAVALLCALLAMSSDRLIDQCAAAGNLDCTDFGAAGMQAMFIAGFVATAWIRAYILFGD